MRTTSTHRDGTPIVALAASAWGLDGLLRKPLTASIRAATIVLWEHVIGVLVLLPFTPSAVRAYRGCSWRDRAAIAAIGVGASALGTALFTEAFTIAAQTHDYITPLVLQQLQPVLAISLAVGMLGERLHVRFAYYVVPALLGSWLLTFRDPFDIDVTAGRQAICAIGAAACWGGGTVLGRMVSPHVAWRDITVLRYLWGLPTALVIAVVVRSPLIPRWHDLPALIMLALIPGVLALFVYYVGIRRTAAARATLAELAFPVTAAVVGVLFLDTPLTGSQWVGAAITVVAVTALGLNEQRARHSAVVPSEAAGMVAVG